MRQRGGAWRGNRQPATLQTTLSFYTPHLVNALRRHADDKRSQHPSYRDITTANFAVPHRARARAYVPATAVTTAVATTTTTATKQTKRRQNMYRHANHSNTNTPNKPHQQTQRTAVLRPPMWVALVHKQDRQLAVVQPLGAREVG